MAASTFFAAMAPKRKLKAHRTRFVAYAAMSIDGRISLDPKKLPDWTSAEDWRFFQSEMKKADAVVAGRATFKAAREKLSRRNTYVFTRRVRVPTKKGGVTFVNPARTPLRALFAPYKRVAIVGGAGAYRFMLEKGLVDDFFLTLEPLVFGRGRPLLEGGSKTTALRFKSVRKLNARGTLLLHYQPKRTA